MKYILFFTSLFFLSGCSHLSYLWQASRGQLALYNRERPLEEVIQDPTTSEELREKLKQIPEIRSFVEAELGEKSTSNYTTFVKLDAPYVTWSLTCAAPFELKLKTWSFPIVGSFPYLGFFKKEKALEWEKDCQKEGLDTYVRGVGAYSTLGYLRDPLLSSMITRRTEDLVNLLFHESMHGIVYLKNQGSFNEQVASYIGDTGEKIWILKKFGEKSRQYQEWVADRKKRQVFGQIIRHWHDELKNYFEKNSNLSKEQKEQGKNDFFKKVKLDLEQNGLERVAKLIVNNASLLAFLTYEDEQDIFIQLDQKFSGRLKEIVQFLKEFQQNYESKKQTLSPQETLKMNLSVKSTSS